MQRRTWTLIGALIGLGLILALGAAVLLTTQKAADREYRIVIPEGTQARIEAGEDPAIIPSEIHLTLGKKDTLVIENRDVVGHQVSDFFIGAGQTLRQTFRSAGVYQGECTIHPDAQIQIIVEAQ
jgi:plastocyanin